MDLKATQEAKFGVNMSCFSILSKMKLKPTITILRLRNQPVEN